MLLRVEWDLVDPGTALEDISELPDDTLELDAVEGGMGVVDPATALEDISELPGNALELDADTLGLGRVEAPVAMAGIGEDEEEET